MSNVRFKNACLKQIATAVAAGTLPAGVVVSAELDQGTLWIRIDDGPGDAVSRDRITINEHSYSLTLSMGKSIEPPETAKLIADIKEIVLLTGAIPGLVKGSCRFRVGTSQKWINKQVAQMTAEKEAAKAAAAA